MKCLVYINTIPLKNIYFLLKENHETYYYLDNKKIMVDDSTTRVNNVFDVDFSHIFLSNKKVDYDLIKKCIENKKHIYFYNNIDSLKELDSFASKNNTIIYIANELLFHPLNEKIKSLDKIHNFSFNVISEFVKETMGSVHKNDMFNELVLSEDLFGNIDYLKLNKDYGPITSYNIYYKNRDRSSIEIDKTRKKDKRIVQLISKTNPGKDFVINDNTMNYVPRGNITEEHKKENLLKYTLEDFFLKKENNNEKNIHVSELMNKIK